MDTNQRSMQEPASLGEYNGHELYAMPFFAVFTVEDPEALGRWYVQALGFQVMFAGPVLHLRRHKYQDILIASSAAGAPTTGGPALTFNAEQEIEWLAAQLTKVQATFSGPIETPWNTVELRVTDPAGHRLVFSSRRAEPEAKIHAEWLSRFEAGKR
jgi:hypothetical protein